jgi:hypothetical protein
VRIVLATFVASGVHGLVFSVLFGNPVVRDVLFEVDGPQVAGVVDFWQGTPPAAITPFGAVDPGPRLVGVLVGLTIWMAIVAAVFVAVRSSLPDGWVRRGIAYGLGVWGLTYVFFETWVPYNVLHEPLPLVGLELALEAVGMVAVGLVLSRMLSGPTADGGEA